MTGSLVKFIVLSSVALNGCSTFYDSAFVTHQRLKANETVITDSGTKAILAFKHPDKYGKRVYCVEPSPDTAAESTRQLRAGLKASAPNPGGVGPAGGNASINLTGSGSNMINIERLFARTQGIQLTRDVLFNACLARVNGFIDSGQYLAMLTASLMSANILVSAEVAADKGLSKISGGQSQVDALRDFYSFVVFPRSQALAWLKDGAKVMPPRHLVP